jgi:FlaA1/EpsC-like NDP-sugar epimerase
MIEPSPHANARQARWLRLFARIRPNVPLAILDVAIVFAAYLIPMVLRFEGAVPRDYWRTFAVFVAIAGVVHLGSNGLFGLYGQIWRYASVPEARRVVLAGLVAGGFVVAADALLADSVRLVPLSVAILGAVQSLIGFGAIRFQSRLFAIHRREVEADDVHVLIVGAGEAGSIILKDLLRHPALGLHPVAFVDDDPRKRGRSMHETPVLGTVEDIPALVPRLGIEQVLLAIPSATSDVVQHVAALCETVDVTLRVLPSVTEIVGGRVTARDIRDVSIDDLLGRQQIGMDEERVGSMLRGRRVLITGGGGSIGSEIARQVLRFDPAHLILLDHDETHLHDVVAEIEAYGAVTTTLADIRDRDRVLTVFRAERPDVVFHAAAHKHVPVLETHPAEAFRTNVLGTANVAEAAVASGVERFVLISTDKAVRPSSVMGASKWFAEQVVRSLQNGGPTLCAVRFGNVLGSRGSVTPTFLRQIAAGGPVTVTDPSMARYFMSIQEAVCLVLQAAAMAGGGEVFTLEMGEPVNILELARKLIRLSGLVPGRDVTIEIVGARPGEKLVEDLLDPDEAPQPSGHDGITVSRPAIPDRAGLSRAIRELDLLVDGPTLAARIKELSHEGFVEDVVRV